MLDKQRAHKTVAASVAGKPLRGSFFRGAQVSGIIALRKLEPLVQLLELCAAKSRKPDSALSVPVSRAVESSGCSHGADSRPLTRREGADLFFDAGRHQPLAFQLRLAHLALLAPAGIRFQSVEDSEISADEDMRAKPMSFGAGLRVWHLIRTCTDAGAYPAVAAGDGLEAGDVFPDILLRVGWVPQGARMVKIVG